MRTFFLLQFISLFTLCACGNSKIQALKKSKSDSIVIRHYEKQSIFYQQRSPDSAIHYANLGLQLSRKVHYRFGEGLMLNRFAAINELYGNLKLAVTYQKEALNIFKQLNRPVETAAAACNLGLLKGRTGDVKTGTALIKKALSEYQNSRDTMGMIQAYTKLGELNKLSGHHDQALRYYLKASEMHRNMSVSNHYIALIDHIGDTHVQLGNYQQALAYYQQGIMHAGTKEFTPAQVSLLNHAGNALNLMGRKKEALDYYQQSLQKARTSNLPEEEARSLISIATTVKDENANEGILHLKKALEIARFIGHKKLSAEIYQSLSDIYRQQRKYGEALTTLAQYHDLLDSVKSTNNGHRIAVLESSYELAESKLHIETLQLANNERTYERNLSIGFALAALVILALLAFFYFKTNRLNRRLEESNEIKDKLFSIIGHDLRNPIGGITQLLAIMEEEELSHEEYHAMVAEMRKQGDISLEILNALLNWGEAQLKGIHIKPTVFDPKEVISKNIAALYTQANGKNISVSDFTKEGMSIYGDINHFDFVLRNLLSNAIKFSSSFGKIEIGSQMNPDSDQVIFSVKDYGKGISEMQQENFLKSNLDISYGTNGEKGTGIGLMLSKEFIKANHGKIWLESKDGEGTTFYFSFPRK